jgi:hypothetical protein
MQFAKTVAAGLALTLGAASLVGTAEAGRRHYHHHHNGAAAAAGIFGFAAGAMLGAALAQPRYPTYYYAPAPVYVAPPPPPVVYEPAPVLYEQPIVVYEPWTPQWVAYCDSRYRSFDRRTGYYVDYNGHAQFCR